MNLSVNDELTGPERIVESMHAIGLFASGTRMNIVFSDVRLTDELNQMGLTEWFERSHPNVPLLLTSNDRAEAPKVAVSQTRRFIAKPYGLTDLHSHIDSMLNRS